jgi:hypothetical protein
MWLERLLREHGLIVGDLSRGDERAIDGILAAIREKFRNV